MIQRPRLAGGGHGGGHGGGGGSHPSQDKDGAKVRGIPNFRRGDGRGGRRGVGGQTLLVKMCRSGVPFEGMCRQLRYYRACDGGY